MRQQEPPTLVDRDRFGSEHDAAVGRDLDPGPRQPAGQASRLERDARIEAVAGLDDQRGVPEDPVPVGQDVGMTAARQHGLESREGEPDAAGGLSRRQRVLGLRILERRLWTNARQQGWLRAEMMGRR